MFIKYNPLKNKIVGILLLTIFLSVSLVSLFQMTYSMDMRGYSTDCPFMSHGETLCGMSTIDHIGIWKATFLATIPTQMMLLLALVAVMIVVLAPNLLINERLRTLTQAKATVKLTYFCSTRPWQELFSSGILHPKLLT